MVVFRFVTICHNRMLALLFNIVLLKAKLYGKNKFQRESLHIDGPAVCFEEFREAAPVQEMPLFKKTFTWGCCTSF